MCNIPKQQISLSSTNCPQEGIFCPQEKSHLKINDLQQLKNCPQEVRKNYKGRSIVCASPFVVFAIISSATDGLGSHHWQFVPVRL